ncbi:hypothetical protein ACRYCC_39575 [Actinomadura scrupuli]|uniref:hypothetical protein n=1 Tax=Actinomadura scrupuli TaxID=559629 RepID=UPI003D98BC30
MDALADLWRDRSAGTLTEWAWHDAVLAASPAELQDALRGPRADDDLLHALAAIRRDDVLAALHTLVAGRPETAGTRTDAARGLRALCEAASWPVLRPIAVDPAEPGPVVAAVLEGIERLYVADLVTEDEVRRLVADLPVRRDRAVRLAVTGLLGAVRAVWAVAELDRRVGDRDLTRDALNRLAGNRHPAALERLRAHADARDPAIAELARFLARRREGQELAEAVRAGSGTVESLQVRALVGYGRYGDVWRLLVHGRVTARDLPYLRDLPDEPTASRAQRRLLRRIRSHCEDLLPGDLDIPTEPIW